MPPMKTEQFFYFHILPIKK